jgi:hypothetical protein
MRELATLCRGAGSRWFYDQDGKLDQCNGRPIEAAMLKLGDNGWHRGDLTFRVPVTSDKWAGYLVPVVISVMGRKSAIARNW